MSDQGPYEMLGQLPSRVPFARRYKVRHNVLGKEVEFRVLPKSASDDQQRAFFGELDELLALDHPCFLPVLERGMVRQRQAYVVPLRDHRTIPQRISDHTFYAPHAYASVTTLAHGLAAQHRLGLLSGPIDPVLIAWDDTAASAYHLQRRRTVPRFLTSGAQPFPEDVRDPDMGTPRADVFHWGFFAYFLLSRGKYPYLDPGVLVPLDTHAPNVPRYLRVAVEAALCWRPMERPEHGLALQKVLMVGGYGGLERPAPGAASAPQEPVETDPRDVEASQVFQAFLADVDELHMSLGPSTGKVQPEAPAGEDPKAPAEANEAPAPTEDQPVAEAGPLEEVPPPPEDDPDLSIGVYQSGSGMAAVVVPGEAPAADEEPSSGFGAELQTLEESAEQGSAGAPPATPSPATKVDWLVAAVGLAAGLVAGWVGRGQLAAPPPRVIRPPAPIRAPASPPSKVPPPRESTSGEAILAIAPSAAAKYHQDDQVVALLETKTLTPQGFPETWKLLRDLVTQRRLPPVMLDSKRLVDMRRTFLKDKPAGLVALRRWLEDLRTVLGPAKERQP